MPGSKKLNAVGPRLDLEIQVALSAPGSAEVDADDYKNEQRARLRNSITNKFGEKAVFQTTIGRSVRMRELTVTGTTVFEHEPARAQADQFLSRHGRR